MSELGAYIKEVREKKNISLEELHEETKIRQIYLEAIENGEFSTLPGEVYLKGFLRTISRELSLEYGNLLELYSKDIGVDQINSLNQIDKPNKALKEIEQEKSIEKRTIILIAGLIILGGAVVALMMFYS
ncbi:MAG: helix-turn-helix domain-containing protein [Clostridia bacterium]